MLKPFRGQQRALGKRKQQNALYCLIVPVRVFSTSAALRSSDTYTWTCPETGTYKFIAKGHGSQSNGSDTGGASGSHSEKTRLVRAGETVSITVGLSSNQSTVVTFSDGYVVTAAPGNNSTPGVASGGDLNINGSAPGAAGANPGANGLGPYGGLGAAGGGFGSGGAGSPGTTEWPGADAVAVDVGKAYGAGGTNWAGGATQGGIGGVMIKRVV